MALDDAYFDAIHIDVVKRKYYNANKVEAVFSDIRRQALELTAENERLRLQLGQLDGRKEEIGDAVISAQMLYREILSKANARAEEILARADAQANQTLSQAKEQADKLLSQAREQAEQTALERRRQEDYASHKVEAVISRIRRMHEQSIEELNAELQDFLAGLTPPEEEEPAKEQEPEKEEEPSEEAMQRELAEKVNRIADWLRELEKED